MWLLAIDFYQFLLSWMEKKYFKNNKHHRTIFLSSMIICICSNAFTCYFLRKFTFNQNWYLELIVTTEDMQYSCPIKLNFVDSCKALIQIMHSILVSIWQLFLINVFYFLISSIVNVFHEFFVHHIIIGIYSLKEHKQYYINFVSECLIFEIQQFGKCIYMSKYMFYIIQRQVLHLASRTRYHCIFSRNQGILALFVW